MNRNLRRVLFGKGKDTKIRDNKGVYTGAADFGQIFRQKVDFGICRDSIQCEIQFHAACMSESCAFRQLFQREIFRSGAHAEALTSDIYRVRAVQHGKFQALKVACRAQKFQ